MAKVRDVYYETLLLAGEFLLVDASPVLRQKYAKVFAEGGRLPGLTIAGLSGLHL